MTTVAELLDRFGSGAAAIAVTVFTRFGLSDAFTAALTRLDDHFQRALNRQRQVIFVTGEAGIGKATLVDVFQQRRQASESTARQGSVHRGFRGKRSLLPDARSAGLIDSERQRRIDGPDVGKGSHVACAVSISRETRAEGLAPTGNLREHPRPDGARDL